VPVDEVKCLPLARNSIAHLLCGGLLVLGLHLGGSTVGVALEGIADVFGEGLLAIGLK